MHQPFLAHQGNPRVVLSPASAADEDNGRVYLAFTPCGQVYRGGLIAVGRLAVRATET